MADEDAFRSQMSETFEPSDYPVANPMALLPALAEGPRGVSNRMTSR